MKQYCLLFLLFLSVSAWCQKTIKGRIIDDKDKPIANASIFLNNTSVGTKADEQGNFSLNIPAGRYELIVSSVGYETSSQTIVSVELKDSIVIRLQVKSELMATV